MKTTLYYFPKPFKKEEEIDVEISEKSQKNPKTIRNREGN